MPVEAAPPGNDCSFRRNGRFRHFNKLTLRDFAQSAIDLDCAGTEMLIRMFKDDLKEDHHGKSSIETAGLTDRPQRTAQGKSRLQAPRARAVDGCRCEQVEAACERQHADRRDEHQAAAPRRGDPQQGAARRNFAAARQSLALQPANQSREAALIPALPGDNRTQRGTMDVVLIFPVSAHNISASVRADI
ncbi:hypothetical protein P0R31_28590 [Bradyrhizobium yuanmingense]|uniref:hypothetical protein n=1 Tax=Bradyrhizobium yuanmingense TaxID=108015 RepID=UPI0023B89DB9|nr:hypothetical protein [Bradyrhizobium yuanmingense]MDF0521209.1 hypothetical protein [Bradyrhizobium yuanmingense]